MFTSSYNGIHDRRDRRPSIEKAAMSSRVSLLPGITASSGRSSGSSSTITQDSTRRSQSRAFKSSHGNLRSKKQKASKPVAEQQDTGRISLRSSCPKIDVFAFLDNNDSRVSLAQTTDSSSFRPSDPAKVAHLHHDDSDMESSTRSHHSDSGVSMTDGSPGPIDGCGPAKSVLSPLTEENHLVVSTRSSFRPDPIQRLSRSHIRNEREERFRSNSPRQEYGDNDPESFYSDFAGYSWEGLSTPITETRQSLEARSVPDSSGYDLLASSLDQPNAGVHPLPPLYRRFSKLNHRILLQMQDEIAEMEEELASIDEVDARYRVDRSGHSIPASRRLDWQWQGSALYARRLDVLGRIYAKVEQYSTC